MSYRTDFRLAISTPDGASPAEPLPTLEQVAEHLARTAHPLGPGGAREDAEVWDAIIDSRCPISWWHHQDDMKRVSRHWPTVLFTLQGTGDDHGDQWVEYHLNGKLQEDRAPDWHTPPFDPKLLTP